VLKYDRAYVDSEIQTGLNLLEFYEGRGVVFSLTRDAVRWIVFDGPEISPAQEEWLVEHRSQLLLALRYRAKRCGRCGAPRDYPEATWCASCVASEGARHYDRHRLTVTQQRRSDKAGSGADDPKRAELRIVAGGVSMPSELFDDDPPQDNAA